MLRLRPMTIGDILDEVFRLYRNHFLQFLGIGAVAQVPLALATLIVSLLTVWLNPYAAVNPWAMFLMNDSEPGEVVRNPYYPPGLSVETAGLITALLMVLSFLLTIGSGMVVSLIMNGALSRAFAQRYHEQPTGLRDAYRIGLRRYWRVLLATLLQGAALWTLFFVVGIVLMVASLIPCIGLLLLLAMPFPFVLLIYLLIRWSLVLPAAVLERAGPVDALRRSWRLTDKSFWRAFAALLLSVILTWVLAGVPAYLVEIVTLPLYNVSYLLVMAIQTVLANIGHILVLPISIGIVTLLYYDLRIRQEGYDVELLVQHVEAGALVSAGG